MCLDGLRDCAQWLYITHLAYSPPRLGGTPFQSIDTHARPSRPSERRECKRGFGIEVDRVCHGCVFVFVVVQCIEARGGYLECIVSECADPLNNHLTVPCWSLLLLRITAYCSEGVTSGAKRVMLLVRELFTKCVAKARKSAHIASLMSLGNQ